MATSWKSSSSQWKSSSSKSSSSKSSSSKSIASIVSKAKAAGKSNSQIQSAFKSVFWGGSSSTKTQTPQTPAKTPQTPAKTPQTPAKTPQTTYKNLPTQAGSTITTAMSKWQSTDTIKASLLKAGYNPSQVDSALKSITTAKKTTPMTTIPEKTGTNVTTMWPVNTDQAKKAAEYAAKFPWAPNPYSSGADSDIAMISKTSIPKTNDLRTGEKQTTEEKISDLTVGSPYTQWVIDTAEDVYDNTKTVLDRETRDQRDRAEDFSNTIDTVNAELKTNINNRMNMTKDTFNQIDARIKEYEDLSRKSFDQSLANQVRAQVRSMAEQGIIGNDQMDAVANLEMSKYRREAELKKIDLEKDLQEQYTNLLKEKQTAIDAIYQDQATNSNQKAVYAQQVNAAFDTISNNYLSTFDKLQSSYWASVTNAISPFAWAEAGAYQAELGSEVQSKIANLDAARATQNPQQKVDYIIKATQAVDQNLGTYVMDILRKEYNTPDFAQKDPRQHAMEVIAKAQKAYKAANTPAATPNTWGM